MGEWISIKDNLPGHNQDVLFYTVNRDIKSGYVSIYGDRICLVLGDISSYIENVTHWMLLPEPPK